MSRHFGSNISAGFREEFGMIRILKNKTVVATSVGIITFIVFIPALQNEFIGDDFGYVVKNTFIRSIDLNLFKYAFLSFQHANWHPLTWISHALDYAVWGLNPMGHHLTNNIFHAVNTFLVVLLVVRLIEVGRGTSQPAGMHGRGSLKVMPHDLRFTLTAAATTGLLFGLHPLRVEAVAWVAERKELLCALFFLLSIMMYVKYSAHASQRAKGMEQGAVPPMRYAPGPMLSVLCFFVLALLSKPMAVSFPFVLLILDWYPFKRIHSLRTFLTVLGEKVPFILLSILASILTVMAQEEGETIISTEAIPLSMRALVAAKCLFAYLGKMMLPVNLMPAGYPYPNAKDVTMFSSEYLLWIVLLTGITIISVVIARKQPLWLSVWIYYCVTLFPVLGIVKAGGMFMADRYSYLPSLGPSFVVGLLTAGMQEKILPMKRRRLFFEVGSVTAGIAILISLSFIAITQTGLWKNDATIQDYLNRIRLEGAIKEYQRTLTIYPDNPDARLNLGKIYLQLGLLDKAIEQFRLLVELHPAEASYRNALGFAYAEKGFTDRAIEQFQAAVQLAPSNPYYQQNLNRAYGLINSFDTPTLKDRFEE